MHPRVCLAFIGSYWPMGTVAAHGSNGSNEDQVGGVCCLLFFLPWISAQYHCSQYLASIASQLTPTACQPSILRWSAKQSLGLGESLCRFKSRLISLSSLSRRGLSGLTELENYLLSAFAHGSTLETTLGGMVCATKSTQGEAEQINMPPSPAHELCKLISQQQLDKPCLYRR